MSQAYFEELVTSMYPSSLLHYFGVHGKISGSIYAASEMEGVLPIIHGAEGCEYHYRLSARRRHYPFFHVLSSKLTEKEIIYGGEEKLFQTILDANEKYKPRLILLIPSPESDVINDDLHSVAESARQRGINTIAVQSELFSHRDKNYSKKRLAEISKQKFNQANNIDLDIMGCGYTEALLAIIDGLMVEQIRVPLTINIETIGWGSYGKIAIEEMADALAKINIKVNSQFPSGKYDEIINMPSASLNIARRLKWAKHMEKRFGIPYLQINTTGKHSGLEGICNFYREIGEKLNVAEKMEGLIREELAFIEDEVEKYKEALSKERVMIISDDISGLPYLIKKISLDYGMKISSCFLFVTEKRRENMSIDNQIFSNLLERVKEALTLYSKEAVFQFNPTDKDLKQAMEKASLIMGTDDSFYEKLGLPLVNPRHEEASLSFKSYLRTLKRMSYKAKNMKNKKRLLINEMGIDRETGFLLNDINTQASREMWLRMWINRKED